MSDQATVGERIREEREWLGFTRQRLAEAMRLTERDIVELEGARQPTESELARLATIFGLEGPGRLLGEPIPAIPPGQGPVCALADGEIGHEDRATIARFAEYLRNSPRLPAWTPPEENP
jgi:transcriptional regulator with XRE-family HTH domain